MHKLIEIRTAAPKGLWTKFVNEHRFQKGVSKLTIDLEECVFVEPFHIVLLACLIEEYYQNDVQIFFESGENLALREYLTAIRFLEYWEPGFDRTSYSQNDKMTNLCLWKLDPRMLSPYVVYAQKYFETNFLKEKSFEPLNISLAELFNNIIDHANSPVSGYTTSQFYPRQGKVRVAVCDFGVGIPQKVNSFFAAEGYESMRSDQALLHAFQKSFSTKSSPQNRGFGLDNLLAIVGAIA